MLMKQEVTDYSLGEIPAASAFREATRIGVERVKRIAIDWLVERGVKRPKRMTVDAAQRMLDRIAERCAYLTEAELITLREAWLEVAGLLGGDWPSEVTMLYEAHGIRRPPLEYSIKVLSFMQSEAGRAALDADEAVEMLDWVLKNAGVPGQGANGSLIRQRISEAAEDRRRERSRLRDVVAAGVASNWQIERLRQIEAAQAKARAVVLAGVQDCGHAS